MAIDTTPSTVATNALNAIPFSSLIGGPLDACIKAQAQAAKTSYEFINEVGLTIDPDTGEKKPVNVTFQYNNNGKLTNLTVPLLVIVPIPYLAIDKVTIDFIANISAASSSVEEKSSDTELGVDATAEASLGVGPFSLKIKASANYSSKQHSKSSAESSYSVEYTMNVHVEGGQADMPSGLQTVLNILQGSSSSVGPDNMVSMFPACVDFDRVPKANLQVTVKDNQGLLTSGTKVQVNINPKGGEASPFKEINIVQGFEEGDIHKALVNMFQNKSLTANAEPHLIISRRVLKPYIRRFMNSTGNPTKSMLQQIKSNKTATLNEGGDTATGITDTNGLVGFEFVLKNDIYSGTKEYQGFIIVTAFIPYNYPNGESKVVEEVFKVPYAIVPDTPENPYNFNLTPSVSEIKLNKSGNKELNITVESADGAEIPDNYTLNAVLKDKTGDPIESSFKNITIVPDTSKVGTPTKSQAQAKVANGTATFKFELETNKPTAESTYTLTISAVSGDAEPITIPVTATSATTRIADKPTPEEPIDDDESQSKSVSSSRTKK